MTTCTDVVVIRIAVYAAENASGSVDFALKYWLERDGVFYLHDDAPEDDSPLPKAMQWLEIAAAAYKPVDPAEIAAKRAAKKADEAGEGGTKTS